MQIINLWDKRMDLIAKEKISDIGKAYKAQLMIDKLYSTQKPNSGYSEFHDKLNPFARVSEHSSSVLIIKRG